MLEALTSDKDDAEIARAYDVHPVSLSKWKRQFLDSGAEIFSGAEHRNRALALLCLDQLQNNLACLDRALSDILIHHDRDSVYTSHDWLHRVLIEEGARISFAMNGQKIIPGLSPFGPFQNGKS